MFEEAEKNEISLAVWCHYMDHGTPATVKDIAAGCKRSESWVRSHLKKLHHFVPGCVHRYREVPVRDRNFGGLICHRAVDGWEPCKRWVAETYKRLVKWEQKKEA